MEWGAELKTLREIEQKTGKTPKALTKYVELTSESLDYYHMFQQLSRRRQIGMSSVQALEPTQIHCYLDGLQPHDMEVARHLIYELDDTLMDWTINKQKAEIAKQGK